MRTWSSPIAPLVTFRNVGLTVFPELKVCLCLQCVSDVRGVKDPAYFIWGGCYLTGTLTTLLEFRFMPCSFAWRVPFTKKVFCPVPTVNGVSDSVPINCVERVRYPCAVPPPFIFGVLSIALPCMLKHGLVVDG